jgi:hypothetical protein
LKAPYVIVEIKSPVLYKIRKALKLFITIA